MVTTVIDAKTGDTLFSTYSTFPDKLGDRVIMEVDKTGSILQVTASLPVFTVRTDNSGRKGYTETTAVYVEVTEFLDKRPSTRPEEKKKESSVDRLTGE